MKSAFQLRFLGPVQIERDGEPVRGFESRKALALLAYLAVGGQPVPRERLVNLFWEDKTEAQGRNNLNWVLNRLSTLLPACLQADRHTVQFLPEGAECTYWLDLDILRKLEAQGDPASLAAAVELYRGEFLEGLYLKGCPEFELWQVGEQERWRRRLAGGLNQLVAHHGRQGEVEQGLQFARRLLGLEPWREEAHREVMRLLALDGQRTAALAQYETCRHILAKELGVEPSEATELLYTQIQAGELEPPALVPRPELPPQPPAPGEPPFKGLEFFDVADAGLFFGREALTARLVQRLHTSPGGESGERFLAVVGTSGGGKSSLVRAGLVAALQRRAPLADGTPLPEGSDLWPMVVITPTASPLESLAASLTRDVESVTAGSTLMDDLARDGRSLHLYVRRMLSPHPSGRRLLLVVDQFEELFTQCRDPAQRRAFIDNLLAAANAPSPSQGEGWGEGQVDGPTIVVITLRADFYHHCAQFENLRLALENYQVYIGPMTPEELRRAIEEPARVGGWDFEPGLVDLLLRDVGKEPGALPLLSHALLETWKRRQGHTLTLDGYTEAGGVHGAIARTAEAVYRRLDEHQQAIARDIFLRLTELGEGSGDVGPSLYTRRRAALNELIPRPEDATAVQIVLHTLADARLITTERETVQVAHEALIREWPTLREWLEESRSDVRMQRLLAAATAEWEGAGREPSYLLRGARLAQFEGWAEGSAVALTQDERAYLDACLEERRQREAAETARQERERDLERRARRMLQGLAGVFLVAAVISGGLAIWANVQRNRAEAAEHDALVQASIGLASQAVLELQGSSPERATLLALEALGNYPYTWQAEHALSQAVLGNRLRLVLPHWGLVVTVWWSSDGTRILTASYDGVAKVWDANTGEELLTLLGHQGEIESAVWSPLEDRIVTTSRDGTAKVWDALTGEELLTFAGHSGELSAAEWSPDGARVATASSEGIARVWDATTGEELFRLTARVDPLIIAGGVSWSPDGSRIATAGEDGRADVWDATTGENVSTLYHGGILVDPSWSPDGTRVATASWDDTVKVWDATTGEELLTFDHTSDVNSATWSPSGETIISTDAGGDAKIWDAATGDELHDLYPADYTSMIIGAVWSPLGERVVTFSLDGTATVWDAATGAEILTLVGHTGSVEGAAWSPSGDRVVTCGGDGTAKVWDVTSGPELLALPVTLFPSEVGRLLGGVEWSPSGDRIVTSSWDDTVEVWDAVTGAKLLTLSLPQELADAAWSPSGEQIATGGSDATVTVWDVSAAPVPSEAEGLNTGAATGDPILNMGSHTDPIQDVSWSPAGERIAATSLDGSARVFDAITGEELLTLAGGRDTRMNNTVHAWSPSGDRIAIASFFGSTATIWDATTGEELLSLLEFEVPVTSAVWSADGTRIVTHSEDGIGRVWDAATGEELVTFSRHTSSVWGMSRSPAGDRIVTGSYDGTARVWDINTGAELALYSLGGMIYAVDWSPDGTRIVVASSDGTAKVLPAWQTTQELIDHAKECCIVRELTAEERAQFGLTAR